ncbi:hypothetical protein ACKWTF_007536 [Chironomus riparius]
MILSRVYRSIINIVDKRVPQFAKPFWEYEAGPKTIFFWAPICKWGLVIAGIKDLTRPAELLSAEQAAAIGKTEKEGMKNAILNHMQRVTKHTKLKTIKARKL